MNDPFLPLDPNQGDLIPDDHEQLLGECLELLIKLTRHKYSVKLLLGVRLQLRMFHGYKSNRIHRSAADEEKVTQRLVNK